MEYVYKVMELVIIIVIVYLCCLGANIFLKKKKSQKKSLFFVIISTISAMFKTLIDWQQIEGPWSFFGMAIHVIMLYFYFIYAYKGKRLEKGIYIAVIVLIQMIVETVVISLQILGFNVSIERLQEHGIENIIGLLASTVIYGMILIVAKKIKISQWKVHSEILKLVGIMVGINGAVALLAYILYRNVSSLTKESLFLIMTCTLFCMTILNIVVFRAMWKISEKSYQTSLELQYMQAQEQQNKNMETVTQNLRQLRHDMNNHIGMLYGLCDTKQYDALHNYLQQMMESTKQANEIIVVQDNPALSIILNNKRTLAEEYNISFTYGLRKKQDSQLPKTLPLTELELCSLFGNILDNAIEACCKQQKNIERRINLMIQEQENGWQICCKNTYGEKPVFERNEPVTQKPDARNHGIGTKAMRSIIKKYQGKLEYQITEEVFEVIIFVRDIINIQVKSK